MEKSRGKMSLITFPNHETVKQFVLNTLLPRDPTIPKSQIEQTVADLTARELAKQTMHEAVVENMIPRNVISSLGDVRGLAEGGGTLSAHQTSLLLNPLQATVAQLMISIQNGSLENIPTPRERQQEPPPEENPASWEDYCRIQ